MTASLLSIQFPFPPLPNQNSHNNNKKSDQPAPPQDIIKLIVWYDLSTKEQYQDKTDIFYYTKSYSNVRQSGNKKLQSHQHPV